MANELTKTTESALVPEKWGPRFLEKLYEPNRVLPRMLNVTGDYDGVGDIAHIAVEGTAWTVNDLGADGALTVQANTLTDVSLTINKEKEVTVEVIKTLKRPGYSFSDRFDAFTRTASNSIREQMESDALALYSDITQSSGSGAGDIGQDEVLDAIRQLRTTPKVDILANPEENTLVFHPKQFPALKKSNLFDYERSGVAGGGGVKMGLPSIFQVPVIFSTQVGNTAGAHQNLLFHKSAFAWAAHREPQYESASGVGAGNLVEVMVCWALYGVKTVIANRAVIIKSAT